MDKYPNIGNFLKSDALLEFMVMHCPDFYCRRKDIKAFKEAIAEKELAAAIQPIAQDALLEKIRELGGAQDQTEKTAFQGKHYGRDQEITEMIKKLRGYKCQFCGTQIRKKDGTYYIEACHIKPKAQKGEESLTNILVLCPNCHKEFDFGLRDKEEHDQNGYKVVLNGKPREARFEN